MKKTKTTAETDNAYAVAAREMGQSERIALAEAAVDAAYQVLDSARSQPDAGKRGSRYQQLAKPLFTDEMFEALPSPEEMDRYEDPLCYYRYFCTWSNAVWHVCSAERRGEDTVLWAWCDLGSRDWAEFGAVWLTELRALRHPILGAVRVELDRLYQPQRLNVVMGKRSARNEIVAREEGN
jgi:hypothetical protein